MIKSGLKFDSGWSALDYAQHPITTSWAPWYCEIPVTIGPISKAGILRRLPQALSHVLLAYLVCPSVKYRPELLFESVLPAVLRETVKYCL